MKAATRLAPHVVYRCFNAAGDLIYVGMTSQSIAARMLVHEHKNPRVAADTVRLETTPYSTRAEAARAESIAIDTECPAYNIRRGADYEVVFPDLIAAIQALPSVGASA